MNVKKMLAIAVAMVLSISVAIIGLLAGEVSVPQQEALNKAIEAADVCYEHLSQDCTACATLSPKASYTVYCPICDISMTRCCSESCAQDDYFAPCLISSHEAGCNTVQDLYWNAYICMECGYYQRGINEDDTHVEAYWHTKDSNMIDNNYCHLPNESDLRALINAKNALATAQADSTALPSEQSKAKDPVAAGDFCELHGIFGCEIPHN